MTRSREVKVSLLDFHSNCPSSILGGTTDENKKGSADERRGFSFLLSIARDAHPLATRKRHVMAVLCGRSFATLFSFFRCSSVGESTVLIRRGSQVQFLPPGQKSKYWQRHVACGRAICCVYPGVAQLVEHGFHKPRVAGSSPATRTACASAARPYPGGRARFALVAQSVELPVEAR